MIWTIGVLVVFEATLTALANLVMFPRLRGERFRFLFYAVGVVIFLGVWSLWAMARGYGTETVASVWVSAAVCGVSSIAAHKARDLVERYDQMMARAMLEGMRDES